MKESATVAIVAAAGCGRRLGLKTAKPFVKLDGRPLVAHSLKTLGDCPSIKAIIIASEKRRVKDFCALVSRYRLKKIAAIVVGGKTRYKSVANCLRSVGEEFDTVLVHDGARPFVDKKTVEDSIRLARRFGGCVVAVPENDTVKIVDKRMFVKKTLDRRRIFRAQTPQTFRRNLIIKAYASKKGNITDDSSLLEAMGGRVKILKGSYANIKITTPEDIKIAEALMRNQRLFIRQKKR
ncbi:MAG: 2-C-methyl-D-erythritol 4-phosphate cytidylyltransferase [Candidatus Omnitrophica bacterium]|nr:2-C-methyl-D-erythritol 4-phosphate cytidylyltransferase [Candidatus Omnitrophota bacterium]MCM8790982.1 2-C-methyl-D-erythritol 4-phosphate cytidylyltransferase [Candidatus Omnitrophota bacterium]